MGILSRSPRAATFRRHPLVTIFTVMAVGFLLQACGTVDPQLGHDQRPPVAVNPGTSSPSGEASPYAQYDVVGLASWYGKPYHGRRTASGAVYNMNHLTAAHPTLPFGTLVAVTNLENGRTVVLTINDRGPFVPQRIIDVSRKAAGQLGFLGQGLTRVGMKVIAPSQG
jgi:rare lipoprotein A